MGGVLGKKKKNKMQVNKQNQQQEVEQPQNNNNNEQEEQEQSKEQPQLQQEEEEEEEVEQLNENEYLEGDSNGMIDQQQQLKFDKPQQQQRIGNNEEQMKKSKKKKKYISENIPQDLEPIEKSKGKKQQQKQRDFVLEVSEIQEKQEKQEKNKNQLEDQIDNIDKNFSLLMDQSQRQQQQQFRSAPPPADQLPKSQFFWGEEGMLNFRTMTFKIRYEPTLRGFRMLSSFDIFVDSQLEWEPYEDTGYLFSLKDMSSTNLATGTEKFVKNPEIKFVVNKLGYYENLHNPDDILNALMNPQDENPKKRKQKRLQMTLKKAQKKIEEIETEIKNIWNELIQTWLPKVQVNDQRAEEQEEEEEIKNKEQVKSNNKQKKENESIEVMKISSFDRECIVLEKYMEEDPGEIESKLIQKLVTPNYWEKCKKSKYMLLDELKKWEKKSVNKLDFQNQNQIDFEEDLRLYTKFHLLEKFETGSVILEENGLRPHLINSDISKSIVFEFNSDIMTQIERQIKFILLMWPDVQQLNSEDVLMEFFATFRDNCLNAFQQLNVTISNIVVLPINFHIKPNLNEKQDNLEEEED